MKTTYILPLIFSVVLVTSCNNSQKDNKSNGKQSDSTATDNPLMQKSDLPFGVPDFSAINNDDYEPAITAGIEAKRKEIKAIAHNDEKPTFDNTIVALEKAGQKLTRAMRPFNLLTGANTNDSLQDLEEKMSPKLAGLRDDMYLNDSLFQRVKSIHNRVDDLDLDHESKHLVDYYYKNFVLAGAELSDRKKDKLKELNKELASLQSKFTKKILASFKASALIVEDSSQLKGMSSGAIKSAADKAENQGNEGYEIPLVNTTQQPALTDLDNRETRKKLFDLSVKRAERGDDQDTRDLILQIAKIRAKQAQLIGYDSYAEWNLQDQMAESPEAVEKFLGKIVPAATEKARSEGQALQKMIDNAGKDFDLEAYDWNHYSEKLRKKKYDLDDDAIEPYFVLDSVLENGVFYAANQLYGLTFKERHDIPVYNDNVRVFEVHDKDGSTIGLFYGDYFKRDNKNGGAWMSNLVGQSKLLDKKPVIYNVCNFSEPAEGDPAFLSYDNVETMFHEFGHALHGFFGDQTYPSLSGTSVARDFVEFPSQFNEHWALHPKILKHYAKHYKTDEVIPDELVAKIKKAANFNRGYKMTELLASAQLDMQWHRISADQDISGVNKFEKKALKRTNLNLENVPPRYRTPYFSHVWGGGYAAGYYAYIWTQMLDADAYAWFQENGGLTRENGQRFRDMILSKGNTEDYNTMFKAFRGQEPSIKPLLKDKGLIEE